MLYNAKTEVWQKATWTDEKGEHECLFNNMRFDPKTIPEGKYMYQVRDYDCTGDWCEIAKGIMVNFWGTILTDEPIDFESYSHGCVEVTDYNYLDEYTTVELECIVFEITENTDEKMISFIGYGYDAGGSVTDNPQETCRYVEYSSNEVSLDTVLSYVDEDGSSGFFSYESNNVVHLELKQFISDVTRRELFEKYESFSGYYIKPEHINQKLKAGTYIVPTQP